MGVNGGVGGVGGAAVVDAQLACAQVGNFEARLVEQLPLGGIGRQINIPTPVEMKVVVADLGQLL